MSNDETKPRVTSITVEWGSETHQPIQYNGFQSGAISMVIEVPPGIPAKRAHAWALVQLKSMGKTQFNEKLDEWQANNRTAKR